VRSLRIEALWTEVLKGVGVAAALCTWAGAVSLYVLASFDYVRIMRLLRMSYPAQWERVRWESFVAHGVWNPVARIKTVFQEVAQTEDRRLESLVRRVQRRLVCAVTWFGFFILLMAALMMVTLFQ